MVSIFKPAIKLMNNLKYPRKFSLIFTLFLIPLVSLLIFVMLTLNKDVKIKESQKVGLNYSITIRSLIQQIQQHRGLASIYLGGDTTTKDKLSAKQLEIESIITTIDNLDAEYGGDLGTTKQWDTLTAQWSSLKGSVYTLTYEKSMEDHTTLIKNLLDFNSYVADSSSLILADKIDNYHFVNSIVTTLPRAAESMGQARALGSGIAVRKLISKDESFKLLYLTKNITELIDDSARSMDIIYKENPEIQAQLSSITAKTFDASRKLVDSINSQLLLTDNITVDSNEYFNLATSSINEIYNLANIQSDILSKITEDQSRKAQALENTFINCSLLIVIVILYLFIGFYLAVKNTIKVIEDTSKLMSKGDLTTRLTHNVKDETKTIIDSLNSIAEAFSDMIRSTRTVSDEVSASSENLSVVTEQTTQATNQIALSIQEVANGSEMQLEGTENVAKVVDEIANGMHNIAASSLKVSESSHKMQTLAEKGHVAVSEVINKMNTISTSVKESNTTILALGERSNSIGQIVETITNIASQTNLLALNAAIEAARAGEHGRGFVVVADEVKKLAELSAQSANEISNIISSIQSETLNSVNTMEKVTASVEEGLKVVNLTGTAFEEILESTKMVVTQIYEISAASEEISSSSEEISASVMEVSKLAKTFSGSAQNVAASSEEQLASMEEIAASAGSLSAKADELQQLIEKFKI